MPKSKSVVKGSYKYDTTRIQGKDGRVRHSVGNGDAVANAMLLHTAKGGTLAQVVKANSLNLKQGDRNDGLFRMSIGVVLRGMIRNGESVKIGSVTVKSLKQRVALPKVSKSAAPVKVKKAKAKKPRKVAEPAQADAVPAAA